MKKTPKEALLGPADWAGYYYRFTQDELRELLVPSFVVEKLIGFHNLLPRYTAVVSTGLANMLEKVTQATPVSTILGQFLLAKCRKRL